MASFSRVVLTTICAVLLTACSDSDDDRSPLPPPPPPPEEPSLTVSVTGSATKGVIEGAQVSLLGADGTLLGSASTTDETGGFSITFDLSDEPRTPLVIEVDGAGAIARCDLQPVCIIDTDGEGEPVVVSFGESYTLPDNFILRAPVESFESEGDNRTTVVHASPLSEFVVAAALDMGSGSLTQANLDVANERLADLLRQIYPSLELPAMFRVSEVALLDATDVTVTNPSGVTDVSVAVTATVSALHTFVATGSTARGDIGAVVSDLTREFIASTGENILQATDAARLSQQAVQSMSEITEALVAAVDQGALELPDGVDLDDVRQIRDDAAQAVPSLVDIWTLIEPGQQTADVNSDAVGFADLILLPETGEVSVTFETAGLEATDAHLHAGYAGQNGPIMVPLEQDQENPDRWHFAPGTTLDPGQVEAVMAGATYFNVHTAAHPAGEIRGQVLPENVQMLLVTPRGTEQVPQVLTSEGFARAAVTLHTDSHIAEVHFTTDLELVAAHLHERIAGVNGPIVVEMQPDSVSPGHWFASQVDFSSLSDALGQARLYFNLHTAANPGGELRGQIVPHGYQLLISRLDSDAVTAEMPVASDASGTVAITYNASTLTSEIHLNTVGIVDPLGAHVHLGSEAEVGEQVFELERDDLDPNHWFASPTLTADQRMQLIDGRLYADVHTAAYPDGEIRGQLDDDRVESDRDEDGVPDRLDSFPDDPTETTDTDGDGTGDNADDFPDDPSETTDSDGDGTGDNADAFPNNPMETVDSDGDGVGDNGDDCPLDPAGSVDSDGNGTCDNAEPADSDGDGVNDDEDEFPNDAGETMDSDGDGVGDNADAFPEDDQETADSDGDGVGDNADVFPEDAGETGDTDGDGVGDNSDVFPGDPSESADQDGDQVGDNADNCPATANPGQQDGDGNGIGDACEASSVTFDQVQAIFDARCVTCHGTSGGLSLAAPGSYGNLVNVPSTQVGSLDRVEPGDSDNSYIIWKLEGRSGIVGARMPFGGVLPDEDIDLIRDWIDAGALQ